MLLINKLMSKMNLKCAIYFTVFVAILCFTSCTSKPKQVLTSTVKSSLKKDSVEKFKLNCGCMRGSGIEFKRDSLFTQVEINPEPPGGMKVFREWIIQNYNLPQKAYDYRVKGNVMISFVVEKNGTLTDFVVEFDKGFGTGEAGIELLKKGEKWKPGIFSGIPVRTKYALPIRLDIERMKVDTNK
jgi:hypothetical protein